MSYVWEMAGKVIVPAGGGVFASGSGVQTGFPNISVGSGANAGSLVQANMAGSASGSKLQLKGMDFYGCDGVTLTVPVGACWAYSGGTPDWAFWSQWTIPAGHGAAMIARIPLNSNAWLGQTVAVPSVGNDSATWGTPGNADNGTYRADVIAAIVALQAMGWYVLLDLHWCAPQITVTGGTQYLASNSQAAMADYQTAIPFWTSIANYFGTQAAPQAGVNNNAILFDLFNEPYIDSDGQLGTLTTGAGGSGSALTGTQIMLSGGYAQHYKQQNGYLFNNQYWQVAGFQQMLNAVRATGAQNVCLINAGNFSSNLYNYPGYFPTDTLSPPQLIAGWHAYCNQGNPYTGSDFTYPTAGSYPGDNTNKCMIPANTILAAGVPVMIGEDYNDAGTACTTGAPHYDWMHQWCDLHNVSHIKWAGEPGGTYAQSILGYKHWVSANGYISDPTATKRPAEGGGVTAFAWIRHQYPGAANPSLNRNTPPGWTFPTPSVSGGTAAQLFTYNSQYDSGLTSFPQYAAFDVSVWSNAVGVSGQYLVAWQNEVCTYFDPYTDGNQAYYNCPGSYTVDINTAAGSYASGSYPSSGWVTISTISGEYTGTPGGLNALTRRAHLVPASYGGSPVNWVRLNFTAGQGSSGNARIMLTADLWAVQSVTNHVDGHLFVGDSTALHSMYHGNVSFSPSVTCLDFGSICRTGGFILTGTITTAGTGYTNGTYIDIPLTVVSNNTGIAANAIGNITIGGGGVTAVTLQSPGYGFTIGDTLSVAAANVGGTGSGFVYTVNTVQSAQKYSSYTPMNLCADMSGWKASQWATYCTTTYPGVFSDFPGQYVWIMLGTNAEQDAPAQTNYSAAMQSIITAAQAAGKTVIIEKMITGTPTEPSNWMSNCNATIATLIANNPGTLLGADMSGWQLNYSSVHPDGYGCASQRIFRAQYACSMS